MTLLLLLHFIFPIKLVFTAQSTRITWIGYGEAPVLGYQSLTMKPQSILHNDELPRKSFHIRNALKTHPFGKQLDVLVGGCATNENMSLIMSLSKGATIDRSLFSCSKQFLVFSLFSVSFVLSI